MTNRDEIPEKVKRAVALRASYRCSFSGCNRATVGPSEESTIAVTMIGKAAHIRAAAPGGRRYDPSMSPQERSSIENAIWLCASHADMIDRDEATYTVELLTRMRSEHEARCASELRMQTVGSMQVADLVAIGPEVIFRGDLASVSEAEWQFRIKNFIIGDLSTLVKFIDSFRNRSTSDRYILANYLNDGRALSGAPSLTGDADGQLVRCSVEPRFPRIRATDLPADWALTADHDLAVWRGDIRLVSGLEALPQKIRTCLSVQRGETPFHRGFGTRLAEYYGLLRGSPWFNHLFKLEVIRQAAIPYFDQVMGTAYTPLQCVELVHGIEVLAEAHTGHWLPVRLDLEVKGLGRWQNDLSIYVSDKWLSAASVG